MVLPAEPTVGDFFKTARAILHEEGYGHMAPAMDNVNFILTKLDALERRYYARSLDFSQLRWIQEYYRS